MSKKEEKAKEKRETIAIANMCRSFLYMNDFLSDTENEKLHKRISSYQDRNKVSISRKQLDSVDFVYKDKADINS